MTDVRLYHTQNGGEVNLVGGLFELDGGLETAAYLSLFGGNELDGGLDATAHLQWWGNLTESEDSRKQRSETQHLLRALAVTTGNLRKLEDAARRDLAWMVPSLADEVAASATMPGLNRVALTIDVTVNGETRRLYFEARWGS